MSNIQYIKPTPLDVYLAMNGRNLVGVAFPIKNNAVPPSGQYKEPNIVTNRLLKPRSASRFPLVRELDQIEDN